VANSPRNVSMKCTLASQVEVSDVLVGMANHLYRLGIVGTKLGLRSNRAKCASSLLCSRMKLWRAIQVRTIIFFFDMGYFFIRYRISHFIFSNPNDLSITLRIDECLRLNFSFGVLSSIPICHTGYFVGSTAHMKINTLTFLKIGRSSMVLFIKKIYSACFSMCHSSDG
jgi:hypothetical protein